MTKEKEDKDLEVVILPEVEADMAADPKLAAFIRDFSSMMRQADAGVKSGQYKTMDDAIEALTGNRPQKLDAETGEIIPNASIHEDLGLDEDDEVSREETERTQRTITSFKKALKEG